MVKIDSKMKGEERVEKNHNHWVVMGCLIWNGNPPVAKTGMGNPLYKASNDGFILYGPEYS